MAAAVLQQNINEHVSTGEPQSQPAVDQQTYSRATGYRQVRTVLNFFKPNEDGSPPHPTYVDRPETYDRPVEPHDIDVTDVAGHEQEFSLDTRGFQIHGHTATEKEFLDDDQIKASYYPETEQLLKDV